MGAWLWYILTTEVYFGSETFSEPYSLNGRMTKLQKIVSVEVYLTVPEFGYAEVLNLLQQNL